MNDEKLVKSINILIRMERRLREVRQDLEDEMLHRAVLNSLDWVPKYE